MKVKCSHIEPATFVCLVVGKNVDVRINIDYFIHFAASD